MASWKNWSGRQRSKPAALHFIRSEADTAAIVRDAVASQRSIRVAGAGHSHAPLVLSDTLLQIPLLRPRIVEIQSHPAEAW